jgi:hypothetical protein
MNCLEPKLAHRERERETHTVGLVVVVDLETAHRS